MATNAAISSAAIAQIFVKNRKKFKRNTIVQLARNKIKIIAMSSDQVESKTNHSIACDARGRGINYIELEQRGAQRIKIKLI